MPIIRYIARQLFTYPFVVKVWEKATKQEANQFWCRSHIKFLKNNTNN
jgi:hypothetical protein